MLVPVGVAVPWNRLRTCGVQCLDEIVAQQIARKRVHVRFGGLPDARSLVDRRCDKAFIVPRGGGQPA